MNLDSRPWGSEGDTLGHCFRQPLEILINLYAVAICAGVLPMKWNRSVISEASCGRNWRIYSEKLSIAALKSPKVG